jgi:hypothetical protein
MNPDFAQKPDSIYPSKRDLWLVILFLVMILFGFYAPFIICAEPVHILIKIFGSIFFISMSIGCLAILLTTKYALTTEYLVVWCAYRSFPIPLIDIYEVYPTHNPLSAPALSLDRLRVKYKGSKFGALISPVDKNRFMHELLDRCPQLMMIKDRLILKTENPEDFPSRE